jgi:hypothetical protein
MANVSEVKHSIPLVRGSYKKLLATGEGAKADDFRMVIEGYPDLEFLIQASQLPPVKREPIESRGPHGVQFVQQGNFLNTAEVPITFKEVIKGKAYEAIRSWVKEKKYLTVTLALISESQPDSVPSNTIVMGDVWLEIDGADLSVDDGTTLVKPAGTLHVNDLFGLVDGEAEKLAWA